MSIAEDEFDDVDTWDFLDDEYANEESFVPIERQRLRDEDAGPKRKTNKKSIRKARERKEYKPVIEEDTYDE